MLNFSILQKVIFVSLVLLTHQETFADFKDEMEAKVKNIADTMSALFAKRCENYYRTCETKSYIGCDGTAQRYCFDTTPTPSGCSAEGAYLSNESMLTFPPNLNRYKMDAENVQFICSVTGL